MPPSLALLFGSIVALFVVFVVVSSRRNRARTEALGGVAQSAGLAFTPKADVAAVRAIADVPLFDRGHSKRVVNLMSGRLDGQQVAVFDYSYTVGAGKARNTTEQTVVLLPSAKASLPDLQMAPENFLTRIGEAIGFKDIDLESNPEFSRRYVVRGADEDAIREALSPRAAPYFAGHEGWSVEVRSGSVAIYRANRVARAEDLRAFVAEACEAARNL